MGRLIPITTLFVLIVEAPAKLNLGLHVLRRRPDGFHDIETVMVRLAWFDTIEVESAQGLSLTCSDPDLPTGSENLCIAAAKALASKFGVKDGARLHLTKRIPSGAGLGGGSSDAASTLRVLSKLWGLSPHPDELEKLAADLGSDIPFFLRPSPSVARGRGEQLETLTSATGDLVQFPFRFAVVKPTDSVPTAAAYQWVSPSNSGRSDLVETVRSCDLERWRAALINDFEEPVSQRLPEISRVKNLLLDAGAGFAGLSGSGSAVFGVFEDGKKAEAARCMAADAGFVAWAGPAI